MTRATDRDEAADAALRRWVLGTLGAGVALFWMLVGIPAVCWLIQQGGQIFGRWL